MRTRSASRGREKAAQSSSTLPVVYQNEDDDQELDASSSDEDEAKHQATTREPNRAQKMFANLRNRVPVGEKISSHRMSNAFILIETVMLAWSLFIGPAEKISSNAEAMHAATSSEVWTMAWLKN
jgi:hypothetical protein